MRYRRGETPATSQWTLRSDNNDMSYDKKNPPHARELKVHTAGEDDSLVQLTFCQKTTAEQACERSKVID